MAKGIAFSFLTVLIFLPALILVLQKPLDRLAHRSLLPNFEGVGTFVCRHRHIFVAIVAVLIIPAFLASQSNSFVYGMGSFPKNSAAEHDLHAIDAHFGEQQQISLLVPRGDLQKEQQLDKALKALPHTDLVISYVSMADPAIPQEVVSGKGLDPMLSNTLTPMVSKKRKGCNQEEVLINKMMKTIGTANIVIEPISELTACWALASSMICPETQVSLCKERRKSTVCRA